MHEPPVSVDDSTANTSQMAIEDTLERSETYFSEPLLRDEELPTKTNYVGNAFLKALFLHSLLVVGFFSYEFIDQWLGWGAEREARLKAMEISRQAIRVDIVDLPRLKAAEMQQLDLTEEVNKDFVATPEEPQAQSAKDDMVDPTKKVEEKVPTPKVQADNKKPDRLKELQERLRVDQRRRDLIAKIKGKNSNAGRPEIAGNQLSEGYSATGEVANADDIYKGKAKAHLQRNFKVPAWISSGTLKARMVIKLAPNGRIIFKEFSRRSGNTEFDESVLRAVEAADPFPPPPENLKQTYMEDGVEFGFPQ